MQDPEGTMEQKTDVLIEVLRSLLVKMVDNSVSGDDLADIGEVASAGAKIMLVVEGVETASKTRAAKEIHNNPLAVLGPTLTEFMAPIMEQSNQRFADVDLSSLGSAYESAMRAGLKSEAAEIRRRLTEKVEALRVLAGEPAVNTAPPESPEKAE